MADSGLIVGEKLSRLSSFTEPLQEKDVFVFSHFKEDQQKYDYTYKIDYKTLSSNLYEKIMPCLLEDDSFLSSVYSILSTRLLNDEKFITELSIRIKPTPVVIPGQIIYHSCYPE